MSAVNSVAIKITFDKEIINDPQIITGYEVLTNKDTSSNTPFASSQYSTTYAPAKAFDADTATYWRPLTATMPTWLGTDWGTTKTFGKVRAYLNSYKPANYQLQGSNNNVDWTDITTGTFTSTTGWQDITFTPATYRYWRLYVTTLQSSYLYIYDLEFYGARVTYDTTAWEVMGYEPSMSPNPEGSLVPVTYKVYRVTKTEDNLSVILWLALANRLRYPQGEVAVKFSGDLRGPGNVSVNGFAQGFTPVSIEPLFNPHTLERVQISSVSVTANLLRVSYKDAYTTENVQVSSVSVTAVLTPVSQLP